MDDCDPTPCENGATCVDDHDGYTCQCTEQWFDENCTGIQTTNIKMLQLLTLSVNDYSSDICNNLAVL